MFLLAGTQPWSSRRPIASIDWVRSVTSSSIVLFAWQRWRRRSCSCNSASCRSPRTSSAGWCHVTMTSPFCAASEHSIYFLVLQSGSIGQSADLGRPSNVVRPSPTTTECRRSVRHGTSPCCVSRCARTLQTGVPQHALNVNQNSLALRSF